ncbi:MAG: DUF2188 domain-containing protein, partial [Bdellovibrionales bacterium]|nr:DUF2188 domain-containing protein [Bdellovibrionales bacterium]
SCLRIAPHPKGWTILSDTEVIPGSFFDEKSDAIERARSDAQFSELALCIHDDQGHITDTVCPFRNY